MLLVLAARMLWFGWALNVAVGTVLLMAFALALSGVVPYMLEIVVFPARVMLGGLLGLASYTRLVRWPSSRLGRVAGLSVILPLVTFLAFSLLFILANPDLLTSFGERVARVLQTFRQWLIEFSPHPAEMVFWCVVGWISIGMLRPLLSRPLFEEQALWEANPKRGGAPSPSPLYAACRNTLATAIGLFAIYLVFEFQTLWFREFPPGFYYSGYAHQGAAWLTVALALATLILSVAFRGSILQDPRVRGLKLLAWIWSLENMLLALAVYHRLYIYIGFNGMTRMRMVGHLRHFGRAGRIPAGALEDRPQSGHSLVTAPPFVDRGHRRLSLQRDAGGRDRRPSQRTPHSGRRFGTGGANQRASDQCRRVAVPATTDGL